MEYFQSFLQELTSRKFTGVCTTHEEYNVFMGWKSIKVEDGSCDWQGFQQLTKTLFNRDRLAVTRP